MSLVDHSTNIDASFVVTSELTPHMESKHNNLANRNSATSAGSDRGVTDAPEPVGPCETPATLEDSLVDASPAKAIGAIIDQARDKVSNLSGDEATAQLKELQMVLAKAEAYKAALVTQIDKSEIWRVGDPNGTANSYLRRELNFDQRSAHVELRTATALNEFPALGLALEQGKISRTAVDLILGTALRTPQRRAHLPHFIEAFIQAAAVANLRQLRRALVSWADQVDSTTTSEDESDARSRRYFHASLVADGLKIDGFFDIRDGMKILAAINAGTTAVYKDRHRKGQLISGPDQSDMPGPGTLSELAAPAMNAKERADAFIKLIIEPALNGNNLPTAGGLTPNVVVTIPLDHLKTGDPIQASSAHGTTSPHTFGSHIFEAVATGDVQQLELGSAFIETTNGPGRAIISAKSARQLSCDANIQRVILGPESLPLDIGRSTRIIPPHLRRALAIRDDGCQFPYCERPTAWCEAHHIQHWSQGGPTSLDNLVLLCSRHHHEVHSASHEIKIDSLGKPQIRLRHQMSRE